jgi:hypothetical protein
MSFDAQKEMVEDNVDAFREFAKKAENIGKQKLSEEIIKILKRKDINEKRKLILIYYKCNAHLNKTYQTATEDKTA